MTWFWKSYQYVETHQNVYDADEDFYNLSVFIIPCMTQHVQVYFCLFLLYTDDK